MGLSGMVSWRTGLWMGLLVLMVIGGSLSSGELLLASWWIEQSERCSGRWRVIRAHLCRPEWWSRAQEVWRWVWVGIWWGLGVWWLSVVGHRLGLGGTNWERVSLVIAVVMAGVAICRLVSGGAHAREDHSALPLDTVTEEESIDLEPILVGVGVVSPADDITSKRDSLQAQWERIRAECFRHPVSRALMERLESESRQVVQRVIEEALEQELNEHLGFQRYERNGVAKADERQRSGGWQRGVRTLWGDLEVEVPKLRRGNRARRWGVLERYERSFGPWLDLQLHLYQMGLSQSDLQEVLYLGLGQELSHHALEHLNAVAWQERAAFREARLTETPPVMIVDGVNIKVLLPTGTYYTNARGRRRMVKRRESRVWLVALGLWPDGHYCVLDFEMVEQESKATWRRFFIHLVERGLDISQLQLVVSDGRPGLDRAIHSAFCGSVRHQRCVFHKLQNLADNLTYKHLILSPNEADREARQRAKQSRAQAILQEAAHIYSGPDIETIQQRLTDFRREWTPLEPKAVRCFLKDFNLTLNYLRVPFPLKHLIRTTNPLDRFFREFRERSDEIGCFGSQAQAETLFFLILQRDKAKRAIA